MYVTFPVKVWNFNKESQVRSFEDYSDKFIKVIDSITLLVQKKSCLQHHAEYSKCE